MAAPVAIGAHRARSLLRDRDKVAWSAVALATAGTAVLALRHLGSKSLWADEGFSAFAITGSAQRLVDELRAEPQFALYHLVAKAFTIFGSSEFVLRLPSAIFATLTVPVVFCIGRRMFGRLAGVIAAFLVASNAYVLGYAQDARPYSIVVLTSSVSMLCLLRALEHPEREARWTAWALAVAVTALSHPFAFGVIVAQVVVLVLVRQRVPWRAVARRAAVPLGLVLALGIGLLVLGPERIDWIPPTSLNGIRFAYRALVGRSRAAEIVYAVGIAVLVVSAIATGRGDREGLRRSTVIGLCWLLTPPAFLFVVSLFQPVFIARYLIVMIPPLAVLAGAGFARMRLPGLVLVLLVIGAYLLTPARTPFADRHDQDWRQVARIVESRRRGGDVVVITPVGLPTYRYYQTRVPGGSGPHPYALNGKLFLEGRVPVPAPCGLQRIWLIVGRPERRPEFMRFLEPTHVTHRTWKMPGIDLYSLEPRRGRAHC